MKRSIFLKVFGACVVLLILLSAIFLILSLKTIQRHSLDNLAHHLENVGRVIEPRVTPLLEAERFADLDAFLKKQGREIKTRLTVIDAEGIVLGDSEGDPAKMENHRFRPEVSEALQGRNGRALRYSSTVKEDMLYVALPLRRENLIVGALRVSLFISEINALLSSYRRDLGRATIMVMALALLGAYFFSRTLTGPIRELARASRRVGAGDFNAKMSLRFKDEWKDVALNFNAMTEEIKSLVARLENRTEELDNILAAMREGLLVLDQSGKIVLSNEAARSILRQDVLEGKFYWQVVGAASFAELVERVRKERKGWASEIRLGDRIYLGSASFLLSQERIVIALSDITDMENLTRVKKDLIVNASHELRTPLAAIKGFAEMLEGEVEEKSKPHIGIILRNTERLIRILDNILILSEPEEPATRLEIEPVNLAILMKNVLKMFEPRLRKKGLSLSFDVEPGLPVIQADPFRLEQMAINLLDNAVKYTERGGVRVSLGKTEEGLFVEVEDTGVGIPEEALPRIFERFYVVDKSRSKKLEGSGLGLSIVKHIVNLHGGRIEVESTVGQGSRFRVVLPKVPSSI